MAISHAHKLRFPGSTLIHYVGASWAQSAPCWWIYRARRFTWQYHSAFQPPHIWIRAPRREALSCMDVSDCWRAP